MHEREGSGVEIVDLYKNWTVRLIVFLLLLALASDHDGTVHGLADDQAALVGIIDVDVRYVRCAVPVVSS